MAVLCLFFFAPLPICNLGFVAGGKCGGFSLFVLSVFSNYAVILHCFRNESVLLMVFVLGGMGKRTHELHLGFLPVSNNANSLLLSFPCGTFPFSTLF